jgi:SagB-type dehydrogenase family enzyme
MFAYHEATKHTVERLYRSPHVLDWENMPEPIRRYDGAPVVDLPAESPPLGAAALEVLLGASGETQCVSGAEFLATLLYHSAAISAMKVAPGTGDRYALRVNPSSGNLHPTEFHFLTRGLAGWDDGLYHYRADLHAAEQRRRGGDARMLLESANAPWFRDSPLVFVLTSIAWREAWKYRDRAYRYCLHDMGHAWESVKLAARAMGCETFALGHFRDADVAALLELHDEWPMLILAVRGAGIPLETRAPGPETWTAGVPNVLSIEQVQYPLIDAMHFSSIIEPGDDVVVKPSPATPWTGDIALDGHAGSAEQFGAVARRRRSALNFVGGSRTIRFAQFASLLEVTRQPFHADFEGDLFPTPAARYITLYAFVHRVDGLDAGIYRHSPTTGTLTLLARGDVRVAAAGLSLSQELAGNSCVTFSMIADLARAARDHGNRGYRYAHFEAGAIGQRLYLAAEALGFQSTGIGAFYDDQVHRYLDIEPDVGQVVYHFASGYAVTDPRLSALA